MKKTIILWAAWLTMGAEASEWKPSQALLRAVRQVESNNGQQLYGDGGRSLGLYQLSEPAWIDINAWRKARGLKVYSYQRHVMNHFINQAYASNYLTMLQGELKRKLRRNPTAGELYAAYNMGLTNFAECRYQLSRVNPVTARKCREIHALIAQAG